MSREVLSPPPVVLVPPDPSEAARRRGADKFGNAARAREVAVEKLGSEAAATPGEAAPAGRPVVPAGARPEADKKQTASREAARPPAFAAAYFTQDVAATNRPSPHAQAQRALRGTNDATDLKKIVLPAGALATVSPETLWQVGERMGVTEQTGPPDVRDLLARLGSWAQAPTMTAERLRSRLAELEDMVAARRLALARMPSAQRARRPGLVLEQAGPPAADVADAAANLDAPPQDPVEALAHSGNRRVQNATAGAAGMHQRLARTLGIKKQ